MRLMLTIIRRAAGLCLLLVMSACGEEPRSAHSADSAKCTGRVGRAGRSNVHAFRRDHRALLGPSGSGRDRLGVAVHVRADTRLASWRDAERRRRTAPDGTPSPGLPSLGPVWVSTAQTWGDAFSAPYVHQCVTTVTIEGDATLDMTISSTTDLVALNASTGPTSTRFARRIRHGVRNHLQRPAAGRKRLGRVGSVCNGRHSWPRRELTRRGTIASAVCHGSESPCSPHRHTAMCSPPRSMLVRMRL